MTRGAWLFIYNRGTNAPPKINLLFLANSIQEYMAQWENIQLGDKVEFKPKIITMKNLFEPRPEPKQMELNLND